MISFFKTILDIFEDPAWDHLVIENDVPPKGSETFFVENDVLSFQPWSMCLEIENRADLYALLGDPGATPAGPKKVKTSAKWARENLIKATALPMGIPDRVVHRLVEPMLREGLRRTEEILEFLDMDWRPSRIGCYAPRYQRHDPKRPLSDHTWAAAVDVAGPDGLFRRIDRSMPLAMVCAMESAGWHWGGWWTWRDDMHFQVRFSRGYIGQPVSLELLRQTVAGKDVENIRKNSQGPQL